MLESTKLGFNYLFISLNFFIEFCLPEIRVTLLFNYHLLRASFDFSLLEVVLRYKIFKLIKKINYLIDNFLLIFIWKGILKKIIVLLS